MKRYLKYILPALVVAAVSWGVAEQRVDKTGSVFPMWVTGGLYVGPLSPNPTNSTVNKVTRIVQCKCDEDFPNIANKYTEINPNPCTCTGVKLGDPCFGGVLQASTTPDGGSSQTIGMELQVIARADNLIEFDLSNQLGDGGALNPFDAGYFGRCLSSQ